MIAGLLALTVAEVALDEIRRLEERKRREKRMADLRVAVVAIDPKVKREG